MSIEKSEIFVSGGGLAGKTAAIALSQAGWEVTLCAPKTDWVDQRTTAFLWDTIDFFKSLGLWEALCERAFPLKTMRIVDGTSRLLRAPQVDFNATEIDIPAFGYNLRNRDILETADVALKQAGVKRVNGSVYSVEETDAGYELSLSVESNDCKMLCGFLVGADGRNSLVRNTLFPGERRWTYPQHAFVVDFKHDLSTQFVSTEFHTETGPFTIVPHGPHKAGLVWLETPQRVLEVCNMSQSDIERLLEDKMQSYLGKVRLTSNPASFPIEGLIANTFGANNAAIVGEAAHVFPPIGAQGFNLGARDIRDLVDTLKRHTSGENRGQIYHQSRMTDVQTRTLGVDMLNRSLLSGFLPNQLLRTGGLYALGKIGPMRKMAMRMGISPAFSLNG